MHALLASLLLSVILVAPAHADSWLPANIQARASVNGNFVIRIIPGKSMDDVYSGSGMPKTVHATAEWYRFNGTSYEKARTVTLPNPISPVDIELTDRGVLVTIDNWHNLGTGNVLAIYTPSGKVVRKFKLSDLYSHNDIARLPHSTSSIQWRCPGLSTFLESANTLLVNDSIGGRFVFNLDSGTFDYQQRQDPAC